MSTLTRMRTALALTAAMLAALPCAVVAADEEQWASRADEAREQYERGEFENAAKIWREVSSATRTQDKAFSVRAALGAAVALRQLGLYQEALIALKDAESILPNDDAILSVNFRQQVGNLYLASHRLDAALDSLSDAVGKAREANNPELFARVLNDYGNALRAGGYLSDALAAYLESQSQARAHENLQLALNTGINAARIELETKDREAARITADEVDALIDRVAPSYEWGMSVLALADLQRSLTEDESQTRIRSRVSRVERVRSFAVEIHNARLLALSYGDQSLDRQKLGDADAAEAAMRSAVFYAAQSQAPDILYRWRWELGRLYRARGKLDAAIEEFEKALATLTPIRQELLNGYRDTQGFFQLRVRPVYSEFIDALLARADTMPLERQRSVLERARDALESLKSAELQDYFRDDCVVAQEGKAMTPEQVGSGSAVLYPIVLPDRIELLLSLNGRLIRRHAVVTQEQLVDSALRLREFIQDPGSNRFLPYANRLYRWLIEPVRAELAEAKVDTLVVVPDGVLGTVPFAALHDGVHYLIESMAVAVTPGLKLTASQFAPLKENSALLTGVAQSVQGFAPLPSVSEELASIRSAIGGRVLSNREYTKANLRSALASRDYRIVHMATHGTVGATPAESFLLTFDGKLTMSDLENLLRIGEFHDQPVDLLTLSACETAVGDERAALGLAGMAVKSGARTVVASLWLVDDESTAALMKKFYGELSPHGAHRSKAQALRAAQLAMLGQSTTAHPANWSAFLLIGHWQ